MSQQSLISWWDFAVLHILWAEIDPSCCMHTWSLITHSSVTLHSFTDSLILSTPLLLCYSLISCGLHRCQVGFEAHCQLFKSFMWTFPSLSLSDCFQLLNVTKKKSPLLLVTIFQSNHHHHQHINVPISKLAVKRTSICTFSEYPQINSGQTFWLLSTPTLVLPLLSNFPLPFTKSSLRSSPSFHLSPLFFDSFWIPNSELFEKCRAPSSSIRAKKAHRFRPCCPSAWRR